MMYAAFTTSFVLLLIKIGENYDDYEACVAGWAVVQIKKVCMEIQKKLVDKEPSRRSVDC